MKMKSFGIVLAVCLLPFFKPTAGAYASADGSSLPFKTNAVFDIRDNSSSNPPSVSQSDSSPIQAEKMIEVKEAVGCGTTRQEALRDAMRKAIALAVGSYVTTELELKDDDLTENIVVASNAVLSSYKELESAERDGVWMVRIRASVRPNEYLKYCPKLIAQDVSTEIRKIVGLFDGNENLEETLDEIYDFYPTKLFDFKKTAIKPAANTDLLNDDFVSLDIDYSASVNRAEYEKFLKSIRDIVEKNAEYKTSITETYVKNKTHSSTSALHRSLWQEENIPLDEKELRECRFIGFDSVNRNKVTTTFYLVRKELFKKLVERNPQTVFAVFSFTMADESESFRAKKGFWLDLAYDIDRGTEGIFIFRDISDIGLKKEVFAGTKEFFPFKNTFSLQDIPTEDVNNIKELMIYILDAKDMFDDQTRPDYYSNNRARSTKVFSEEAERTERKFLRKTADR